MPHQKPVQGSHQGEDTPAIATKTPKSFKNVSKNTPLESTTTFQFGYREFEGKKGKRLLHETINYILSNAERDLWLGIVEYQEKYQQAYIGVKALAKFMGRCIRTISNGLKKLSQRGLLILRQDWISRQNDDESDEYRFVTLKLFQSLYDLAYRFLQWRRSPEYVPPTWEYAEFILNHEEILDQVRDFACYQRLFKKKPGPKPQSQGLELRPAIRCANSQCDYCYQHLDALESEIRMLGRKLVNTADMLKCDRDKVSALWNKYLKEYPTYNIDTRVYNSLTSNSNSKLDFLQKWLELFLREEERLRQRYSCEHCRQMALTQGLLCGQHSRDERPFSSPAFGEIGPEQASEREASVQAEEPVIEASERENQVPVVQAAVLAGGNDWQASYQPLAQGPLTHEELARRKAGGGKAPQAGKQVAQEYRPQRLPGIEEQKRMQPRQPLTRRLMLLGYSVSEKLRDSNPYSTQSCLVNHMQRLLHFAAEARLENHASLVEDWFYQAMEHYRDAAYALPGVRSHNDQGQIKRMPWFITALKNAVDDACKALLRGESLPDPAPQTRDKEVYEEATTPVVEPHEEDSMQPAEPYAADKTQKPVEQSSALSEVMDNSYSHDALEGSVGPVEENEGQQVDTPCDGEQLVDTPCDEGQQASVAVEEPQPVVDPFPFPARLKVKRLLARLGVQEEIVVNAACLRCNGHLAYVESRGDGGKDYYCCYCSPAPYWPDDIKLRVREILSLPVEELKRLSWR